MALPDIFGQSSTLEYYTRKAAVMHPDFHPAPASERGSGRGTGNLSL